MGSLGYPYGSRLHIKGSICKRDVGLSSYSNFLVDTVNGVKLNNILPIRFKNMPRFKDKKLMFILLLLVCEWNFWVIKQVSTLGSLVVLLWEDKLSGVFGSTFMF